MSDRSDPLELLQLIRLKLLESSDITDLVGERVHTSHYMDFDDVTRQLPCIILELAGGDMAYNQKLQQTTVYIYAYSSQNSAETLNVYHKCTLALHAQRIMHESLTLKGLMEETTRPISGYNDKVRSWYCRGSFIALMVG
tara:strand:+ start:9518 stop:9937 length:420 start_codon:yes stop_codon:yes gene_type:complete